MTWRKWWALEILAMIGIIVVTEPLSWTRFFILISLTGLFAFFYMKRVTSQPEGKL